MFLFFFLENLGFAKGVNLGIKEAINRGYEQFLLLNNDTIVQDGLHEKISIAYKKCKGGLISPSIKWGNRTNRGYYYHKYLGLISNKRIFNSTGWFYYMSGCALAFDRDFIDIVGYFDEKFFMYGEDIELAYRATRENLSIDLIPDILIHHLGSHSSKTASFFYEYHLSRSHYLLCFIFFNSLFKISLALLAKTIILTLRAVVRCIRYKTLAPLKGFILAPFSLKVRP